MAFAVQKSWLSCSGASRSGGAARDSRRWDSYEPEDLQSRVPAGAVSEWTSRGNRMSNHIVVSSRGTRIFRFTVIFSLALSAFVLCVDLLALKLSGGDFLSAGNAKFVLCLTG